MTSIRKTEYPYAEAFLLPDKSIDPENRYREIVEKAGEIIYRTDLAGHFTFVNQSAAAVVRRRVEECIGVHFLSLIRPDHQERARDFYYEQIAKRMPRTYFEFPAVTSDGEDVWIGQDVQLIIEDGAITELQGFGREITQRRHMEVQLLESESRYRLLFEANPHPTWVYETESLRFLMVNNAAIQSYGYSAGEFREMTVLDIRPEEEIARFKHREYRLGTLPDTWKHMKKDGTIIDVEITTFPLIFDDKKARLITATDITARLKAESERQLMEDQLRQAQKMEAIGRLAGGVAHDFNNLLTAISGYSDIAMRKLGPSAPVYHNLKEISTAAGRAAGLTRQLLAFSRKQVLQPKVFDLNAVVSDMQKMLRRLIGEDLELITELEPKLGRVMADPGQIEQVLMNLVVNSRDAIIDNGRITIHTANVPRARVGASENVQYVMLAVSDTGVGMDAATQKHIFDPFFTTKEPGKGTGLGLSTVYGVIEQSGGKIEVESQLGQGSCFKVYLPRVDKEPGCPNDSSQTEVPAGHETILIVEDEKIVRDLAKVILELSGYKVLESADGPEAIELVANFDGPIDLLLSDVVMPKMNGPTLAEQITRLRPTLKTILMSGYADNELVAQTIAEGRIAFLQKPFSPDSLAMKVREVLDSSRTGNPTKGS